MLSCSARSPCSLSSLKRQSCRFTKTLVFERVRPRFGRYSVEPNTRACDLVPGRARGALAKAAAALSQSRVRHGQRPGRCPLSGKAMQRSTWTPNQTVIRAARFFSFFWSGVKSPRGSSGVPVYHRFVAQESIPVRGATSRKGVLERQEILSSNSACPCTGHSVWRLNRPDASTSCLLDGRSAGFE